MRNCKFVLIILAAVTGFVLYTKDAFASEGTIELRSTTSEPYRCFAASLKMQNSEYRIPFSCRNLIYPAGVDENVFNYIMWGQPKEGGKIIKLGSLGLGKGEFKTKSAFSALFVTTEQNKDTKTPSSNVVMRGEVEPIQFLQVEEISPTPTQSLEEEEKPTPTPKQVEVPTKELSTREKLFLALRRAGIAALFAFVALIGLVFVITRSRG